MEQHEKLSIQMIDIDDIDINNNNKKNIGQRYSEIDVVVIVQYNKL